MSRDDKPLDRSRLSQTFGAFERQQQQVSRQVQQERQERATRYVQDASTVVGLANGSIDLYNNLRPLVHPAAPEIPRIPDPHTWRNLGR